MSAIHPGIGRLQPAPIASAMWRIYHETIYGPPLPGLADRFMPFPQALETIRAGDAEVDDDPHRVDRIRRSLVKLRLGGLLEPNRIALLGGDDRTVLDMGGLVSVNLEELRDAPPERVPGLVYEAKPRLADRCPIKVLESFATLDGLTLVTTASARTLIERPLGSLAASLDPRSWGRCAKLFRDTERVARGADDVLVPKPGPPDIGHSWCGLLDERVNADGAYLRNLLTIAFEVGNDEMRVRYRLHQSLDCEIAGVEGDGLMRRNEGSLKATPSATNAAWTEIEVWKRVRFEYTLANQMAAALFCLWVDEASHVVPCC